MLMKNRLNDRFASGIRIREDHMVRIMMALSFSAFLKCVFDISMEVMYT